MGLWLGTTQLPFTGIFQVALACLSHDSDRVGAGLQLDLFPTADFEAVGLSFANGSPIHEQFDLRTVGVGLDFRDGFFPDSGSAGGEMNHRLGIPVGFVEVEGVLFDFTVVRDEAFVI